MFPKHLAREQVAESRSKLWPMNGLQLVTYKWLQVVTCPTGALMIHLK